MRRTNAEGAGVGANWKEKVKVPRREGAGVCVVCAKNVCMSVTGH